MRLTWEIEPLGSNITRWSSIYSGMSISMLEGVVENEVTWYVDDLKLDGTAKTPMLGQFASTNAIKEHNLAMGIIAVEETLNDILVFEDIVENAGIVEPHVDLLDVLKTETTKAKEKRTKVASFEDKDPLPYNVVISIGEKANFFKGSPAQFITEFGLPAETVLRAVDVEALSMSIEEYYTIEIPEECS